MRTLVCLILTLVAAPLAAGPELRLSHTRESLTGTHRHYRQYVDGVEIIGAGVVESRGARSAALQYVAPASAGDRASTDLFALPVEGAIRFVRRSIVRHHRLEPYAHYTDVETGEVLRVEPLFFRAAARVFDPNPVAKLNDPSLHDQNNSANAVPEAGYTLVDIPDLETEGFLRGPSAMIVDVDPPAVAPVSASASLLFDRSQSGFEDVNAYYHVDRVQRYLQSLGFAGPRRIAPYAIPIDTHAAGGTDSSFFLPGAEIGRGTLYFGDGGTDDAEDADLITHEYGHALLEWIAPGAFGGTQASESRAVSEGFCDYVAFTMSYAGTVASGRDPACFADWDTRCVGDDPSQACAYPAPVDCLRRVDSMKTFSDYIRTDAPSVEHRNGEIWSSALRDIFLDLVARYGFELGKKTADALIVESMFGTPPSPTFRSMAAQLITADELLNHGTNAVAICAAMTLRGIVQPGECDRTPRGERTLVQSGQHGLAIPENNTAGVTSTVVVNDDRTIEKLAVQVSVTHAARGDLRISLIGPDGTEVLLQRETFDLTQNIVATYGLDAQPAQSLEVFRGRPARGTWTLRIADVRPRDAGTLVSWGLVIQFAGDVPLADRPRLQHRWHVAAVAHTRGSNGTLFITDARVFNSGSRAAEAMLIFTPSGDDGNQEFAAARLSIAPGQVIALGDVVTTLFQTAGTGQLEIAADVPDLVVTTRTYTRGEDGGTFGQFVPAVTNAAATARSEGILYVHHLEVSGDFRSNIGFAEVAGEEGVVRAVFSDVATGNAFAIEVPIEPFGHIQVPVARNGTWLAAISVAQGGARVVGYGSVVDNRSGDAIYMTAQPFPESHRVFAPAISSSGAQGTEWRSDVLLTNIGGTTPSFEVRYIDSVSGVERTATIDQPRPPGRQRLSDIVGTTFESPGSIGTLFIPLLPGGLLATSRVWTPSGSGSVGQFVPLLQPSATSADLLHIENSPAARTNVGLIAPEGAEVTVRVHDAAGKVLEERDLTLLPRRLVQFPIGTAVVNGRVSVIARSGEVIAYASVVDNISGDAIFVTPPSLRP